MDNNSIAALIVVSGTPLAAIRALVLSHRGFASIGARLGSLDGRFEALDSGFTSIERRLDMLHTDLRDLHSRMKAVATDVALIKHKLSL
jgi:hypothetical protein